MVRPYFGVVSASMDRDARDMRDEPDVAVLVDSPLRALAQSLLISSRVAWSIIECARRTRLQMIPPGSLVASQGWGLIDLPLRASNEGLPISYTLFRGSGQVALYCAHRTSTF